MIEDYGGKAISDDGKEVLFNQGDGAKEAWQYIVDLTLKHKVSSAGFFEGELEAFAAGKSCMTPQLTFAVGFMRDSAAPGVEWAVAPMPAGPAGSFTTGSTWPIVLTSKGAADPARLEAATKFLEFVASEKGQQIYTDYTGEIPSRTAQVADPKYSEDPILKPFVDQLDTTNAPFWADELGERDCVTQMYDSVIVAGADPMTALDEGAACVQAIRNEFFNE